MSAPTGMLTSDETPRDWTHEAYRPVECRDDETPDLVAVFDTMDPDEPVVYFRLGKLGQQTVYYRMCEDGIMQGIHFPARPLGRLRECLPNYMSAMAMSMEGSRPVDLSHPPREVGRKYKELF